MFLKTPSVAVLQSKIKIARWVMAIWLIWVTEKYIAILEIAVVRLQKSQSCPGLYQRLYCVSHITSKRKFKQVSLPLWPHSLCNITLSGIKFEH